MLKKLDIKVIIAVLVLLAGALYLFISGLTGNSIAFSGSVTEVGFESAGIKLSYDYSSNLNCYSTDNGFFFCSKDGIKFITSKGDTKFDYTLNLSAPELAGGGKYAAVAEGGGKTIYVFSEDGLIYTKSYDESIVSFSISENGYASVIVKSGSDYNVYVYNTTGENPANAIFQDRNVFPVSSDISKDGQILAVSSLNINSIDVASDILLYYTKEDAAGSLTDGIFGTVTGLNGQIAAKLKFMEGNYLVSISNSHITSIATGTDFYVETKWSFEFDNEITHVAFPDEKTVVLATGKSFVNRENAYDEGVLLFFDIYEGLVHEYETGSEVTYLSGSMGAVIAGGGNIGRTFTAVNTKGKALWTYTATQDVKDIQFLDKTDKIIFVSPLQLEVLELKKLQQNKSGVIETEYEDNTGLRRNTNSSESVPEESPDSPDENNVSQDINNDVFDSPVSEDSNGEDNLDNQTMIPPDEGGSDNIE